MSVLDWFRRPKTETRASGSGFTAEVLAARESFITGRRGQAELTATVQSCAALWEGAFASADVRGTALLSPSSMAMAGRALALRGEFLALIEAGRIVPASDWDVTTRRGVPTAYRLTLPDTGGGASLTALAGEVLHLRIGADPVAPWAGVSPLRRASLTAGMLQAVETALAEVFLDAPLGSQVVPLPEVAEAENLARSFRGQRGRVLMRESVTTTAAGGPTPRTDWRPPQASHRTLSGPRRHRPGQRRATAWPLSMAVSRLC